jgi:signal transduction histidine kinase
MASRTVAADRPDEGLQAAIEDDVRRMVARELHDRVAQTLTGMLVDVENFKTQQVGWDDVLRQMEMVQSSTRQVLTSLRQLLHDLRGEDQFTDGFVDALGVLVARFEEKTRITAKLDVQPGWPESLTSPAKLNLYRIVEEALTNVGNHSGAHTVQVVLERPSDSELALLVGDDGRGIDTDASRPMGLGTVGMKERAMFLGGRLRIESEAGVGTKVHAVFPKSQLISVEPTSLDKTPGTMSA